MQAYTGVPIGHSTNERRQLPAVLKMYVSTALQEQFDDFLVTYDDTRD